MRLIIVAHDRNEEVIAEPFEIEGTSENFAVHRALHGDAYRGNWVATHVETSFAVGRADSVSGAIQAAREAWTAATPEERADRLTAAKAEYARRMDDGRGLQ